MNRLVSVVICNYNYGRFLAQCLDSVLAQTYSPIEIIVVDDGSTDDSRQVLQRYEGRVISILQSNQGQAAAMNAGAAACTGDYICFLDSDDGWYPDKIECALHALEEHPQAGWVRHKLLMVDEAGASMERIAPNYHRDELVPPDPLLVLERIITAGTTVVLERAALREVFPLPASGEFAFDADALVLGKLFRAGIYGYSLNRVLGFYRRHHGQRYAGTVDMVRMLQREIDVGNAIARVMGFQTSGSVAACKHVAVIAAVQGEPLWGKRRFGALLAGLTAAGRLYRRPPLLARQTAALLFAYTAPDLWLRKLKRSQAFATPRSE